MLLKLCYAISKSSQPCHNSAFAVSSDVELRSGDVRLPSVVIPAKHGTLRMPNQYYSDRSVISIAAATPLSILSVCAGNNNSISDRGLLHCCDLFGADRG